MLDKQIQPDYKGEKRCALCLLGLQLVVSSWTADADAAAAAGTLGEHEFQATAHRDYRSAFLKRTGESGFE